MPNVQAYRSDDDATASVLARPVIYRACLAEKAPHRPAGTDIRELAAIVGEARDTRAIGLQRPIALPEIGSYRSNRWHLAQWSGVVLVKRNPGFGNMAPAPVAAR